jgi:hypothetical protein
MSVNIFSLLWEQTGLLWEQGPPCTHLNIEDLRLLCVKASWDWDLDFSAESCDIIRNMDWTSGCADYMNIDRPLFETTGIHWRKISGRDASGAAGGLWQAEIEEFTLSFLSSSTEYLLQFSVATSPFGCVSAKVEPFTHRGSQERWDPDLESFTTYHLPLCWSRLVEVL